MSNEDRKLSDAFAGLRDESKSLLVEALERSGKRAVEEPVFNETEHYRSALEWIAKHGFGDNGQACARTAAQALATGAAEAEKYAERRG
jgi:hypothetical protein